ncbi:ABC transporter substrate-binding protein [Thermodesulfobacteriota bacterium]
MQIKRYMWLVVSIMLIASLGMSDAIIAGPKPIKIGFVGPFSGPMGDNGQQMLRGAYLAIKKINDNGGLLGGRPVELVELDDQGDPAQTTAVVRKGISVNKVKVIAGTWDPGSGSAAWEVCNEENMPFVQWGSGTELIMNSYKGHFQQGVSPSAEVYPVIEYMESHNLKSIVMVLEDFAWSRDCEYLIRQRWDKPGSPVKIKESIWVPLAKADLTAEATKAMSYNADAICFLAYTPPAIAASINAQHQLGYKGPKWGFGPLGDPAFVASFGPEADGIMLATWFAEYPEHKVIMDCIKAYKEAGYPGFFGDQVAMSYDTLMIACLGIQNAGTDSDTEKIADGWAAIKDYTCVCGNSPYKYENYNGALRLNREYRYMVTIQGGKMINPEWFKFKYNTIKADEALNERKF